MIKSSSPSPQFLRRTLQYAEWGLLLMLLVLYGIDQYSYPVQLIPDLFPKVAIFTAVFFSLSFVFPIQQPHWQRQSYVAIEIILVLIAQLLLIEFQILLYLFLIKSCFLLSRREVLITVILAGVGSVFCNFLTLDVIKQKSLELMRSSSLEELYKPQVILISNVITYVGVSLFVVLLGFVIVAERQSRQRAEALSQEIEMMAAALERTRIARDIHDSLGHSLTSLNVQLELVQAMEERDPARSAQALQNAQHLASHCLDAVRLAVQTVRQEFNLSAELYQLIAPIRQSRSYTIYTAIDLPSLPMPISHQLFCVVQEGLTNIQKHSGATSISLRGWVDANAVFLELQDDGQGFDPSQPCNGYGLVGMYERAHLMGGELQIVSAVGEGTQIRVMIPL